MDIIAKYFPELTSIQREQLAMLEELYRDWNAKINVISRKDIDKLYVHHVLHSLAIAKVILFVKGTRVLDIGTGGGFPGIPLAIFFPQANFLLVDSIGKKITVTSAVAEALKLKNVKH
jgi:16S rRNA (guanine527-N7)-methyltransferase